MASIGRRTRGRNRALQYALTAAAGTAAVAGLATWAYRHFQQVWRLRRCREQLEKWCERGTAQEPVIECEVPITHGISGEELEYDVVEIPVGLLFECERLRTALSELLKVEDDEATLVEALQPIFVEKEDEDNATEPPMLHLPWVDLGALAQLTYWYDRRPRDEEEDHAPAEMSTEAKASIIKFKRHAKKLSNEKVIYGTVALRYRTRGHLGQQVFRRPAGVDVTRLATLQRAASLCGHDLLLQLVEETMEQLRPKNVARIPWSEVKTHASSDDLWLLIDGKVYDVTPFIGLHPGGGQLILDAASKDATSLFESTHGFGLRYSLRLLNQFFIGECEGAHDAEKADPKAATPEFLETLRSITGALHTFDEARATGEAQGLLK